MVSDVKKKLDAELISKMAEKSPRELIRLSEKTVTVSRSPKSPTASPDSSLSRKIILLSGPTSAG